MFDPAQIAGGAVYAILLYLGLLYALQLIPAMSGMALGTRGTVALVGSLVLTGIPFGIIAWMRDRLAHQLVSANPEQILRLDDAVRWLVPQDILQAYAGPMTTLRLNLLDLLAYSPRIYGVPRVLLGQVVEGVGAYYKACLKAGRRLPSPSGLLMTLDRTPPRPQRPRPARRRRHPPASVACPGGSAPGAVARRGIDWRHRDRGAAA